MLFYLIKLTAMATFDKKFNNDARETLRVQVMQDEDTIASK
jgi:hypothetical protein